MSVDDKKKRGPGFQGFWQDAGVRRLAGYLKPYRSRLALGILLGVLSGGINALLIADLQFVTSLVFPATKAAAGKVPSLVKWFPALAGLSLDGALWQVLVICGTIPVLMGLRGLLGYFNSYCMLWVSCRVLDDIRVEAFRSILRQSMEYFNRARAGELVQLTYAKTAMAQTSLATVVTDSVKHPISILSALGTMLWMDWKFTVASLVLFPLCIVPVALISRKVRQAGKREEEATGEVMVRMQEAFAGVRVVKTYGREDYEVERFRDANRSVLNHIMRWRRGVEMGGPLVETIASLGAAAALYWAWSYGDYGTFMGLNGGLLLLYPAFKGLSRLHLTLLKCTTATEEVFEVIDRVPAVTDVPNALTLPAGGRLVEFRGVGFSYGDGREALRGISFSVEPGRTCALVGASGAGKTTILSLLQRLYDVTEGEVRLDGHDIRELSQAFLRSQISVVSQETFLFHDTIEANIRYGRLDATDEEVREAAKLAFAHEFIESQPRGYQTVIGDKGCLLSGGQQQRISIARALLKGAPVLLLDEATSALDTESEKQIQAALMNLARGRTVIAIAHRLSTILGADEILVMQEGEVVERGTHAELHAAAGVYRRLHDLQFSEGAGVA
jgi:subfamily B ATP-binding cassette protein MsbA